MPRSPAGAGRRRCAPRLDVARLQASRHLLGVDPARQRQPVRPRGEAPVEQPAQVRDLGLERGRRHRPVAVQQGVELAQGGPARHGQDREDLELALGQPQGRSVERRPRFAEHLHVERRRGDARGTRRGAPAARARRAGPSTPTVAAPAGAPASSSSTGRSRRPACRRGRGSGRRSRPSRGRGRASARPRTPSRAVGGEGQADAVGAHGRLVPHAPGRSGRCGRRPGGATAASTAT